VSQSQPVTADRVSTAEDKSSAYQPYIPASESPRELTFRGLALGSVLGIVFAASSVYLAVKVGMTVSASIPIAVLSIAIFRAFGKSSILENTIVQTTGSAGESLAFGVAAALPALLFLGYDIDLMHAFLVAALGGVLGVLMMIPLRHGLIVQEHGKLMYPEGTACADVLIVGEQGGTNARTVIGGFVVGTLYKFAYSGLKLWREVIGTTLGWVDRNPTTGAVTRHGYNGGSVSVEISPELLGVGYIIGPKVAGVTFAGGVLSYLILIPAITFFGGGLTEPLVSHTGKLIRDMGPDAIRDAYVLYIGAGAVATGGLISLIRSFPTIISAFRRGIDTFVQSRKSGGVQLLRTEQDLPITVVLVGSLLLIVAILLAPPLHVNLLSALLIIVCGFFFVTVSSRITGEIGSSSNPISGMVVATLLLTCLFYLMLGWTSPSDRFMALTTAAIVGIAASNGGTTAQDLKTAYLVGGTPHRQQVALFVGVITSALFIGGTLWLLNEGATATIPEQHPAQKLTVITEERTTQRVFQWSLDTSKLETHGATPESIAHALWAQGYELIPGIDGAPSYLRTFKKVEAGTVQGTTVSLGGMGQARLSELGEVTAAPERSYRVGFARGDTDVPPGKYLVSDDNQVEYLVDSGIGGRITEYQGKKYTHYGAPKARLFSLIIDGILTQKLPWDLVLLGVFIALMLELCGVSSLPFAVGVYLPISTSAPIFAGGVVRYLVDRARGGNEAEAEFSPGVLLSSGYIAGGAIAGVVLAMIALPAGGEWLDMINLPRVLGESGLGHFVNMVGESEAQSPLWSNLWGLAFFAALAIYLLRTGLKGEAGAAAKH
jgi:putative OPT family oligopeptide transporter